MLRRGLGEISKSEVGDAELDPCPGQVFDRQALAALDCLAPENDSVDSVAAQKRKVGEPR